MVYVDTVNGVDNSSCRLGEIELPCKSLSFASNGRPDALLAELKRTSHQLHGSDEECHPYGCSSTIRLESVRVVTFPIV